MDQPRATPGPSTRADETTRDRILTAGIEAAAIHGVRRLSVSDVAQRAGVSRPTFYKHFSSRDDLIAAAVLREADRLTDIVVAAVQPHDDLAEALQVAIVTTLRVAREHPLLDRIIRTEPETLLPLLTADGGPAVPAIREVAVAVIGARIPDLSPLGQRRIADVLTRLLVSYAVSPPDDPPEVVAASLADLLVGGVWSTPTPDSSAAPGGS